MSSFVPSLSISKTVGCENARALNAVASTETSKMTEFLTRYSFAISKRTIPVARYFSASILFLFRYCMLDKSSLSSSKKYETASISSFRPSLSTSAIIGEHKTCASMYTLFASFRSRILVSSSSSSSSSSFVSSVSSSSKTFVPSSSSSSSSSSLLVLLLSSPSSSSMVNFISSSVLSANNFLPLLLLSSLFSEISSGGGSLP